MRGAPKSLSAYVGVSNIIVYGHRCYVVVIFLAVFAYDA